MRSFFLTTAVLFSFTCLAQQFIYSNPFGNFSYAQTQIIGRVKNNIIVWKYTARNSYNMKRSEILVYDNQMHLLNTTSFKSITPELSSVEFVNNGNSFSAVIQYKDKDFYICKLVNFDADGNILNSQILERSPLIYNEKAYEIKESSKDKSFVLIKTFASDSSERIAIKYYFIKNGLLNHSDKIVLPFNELSSGLGKILLDDNNLIITINFTTDSAASLALFKVDLSNNSSINTIRNLDNGYLVSQSISINENGKYYIVVSAIRNQNIVGDKCFLWQLNKDLTDIISDTVFNIIDTLNTCFQNFQYFKLNSVGLKNNTADILVSADNIFNSNNTNAAGNYYTPYDPAHSPQIPQRFYEGRIFAMTQLNGNGVILKSNVPNDFDEINNLKQAYGTPLNTGNGYATRRNNPAELNGKKLAVLNVDAENNLKWTNCFDESIEANEKSAINESVFINTPNALHILYSSFVKGKQVLYDIILNADGTYERRPIISMNFKYKYMLSGSMQSDDNSLIIPCNIKGKLAFAKFVVN